MAKGLNFTKDQIDEASKKAHEHVDAASQKPFFGWAGEPQKDKYGDPNRSIEKFPQSPIFGPKLGVKPLVDLLPTKEQMMRPVDAAAPLSDPE